MIQNLQCLIIIKHNYGFQNLGTTSRHAGSPLAYYIPVALFFFLSSKSISTLSSFLSQSLCTGSFLDFPSTTTQHSQQLFTLQGSSEKPSQAPYGKLPPPHILYLSPLNPSLHLLKLEIGLLVLFSALLLECMIDEDKDLVILFYS